MNTLCSSCGSALFDDGGKLTSPVPEILCTNNPPSTAQASLIKETLANARVRFADINTEIARVQTVLDQLQRERDAIRDYYQKHKSMFSPIRRFPPELLGEIFSTIVKNVWRKPLQLPLMTVCRRWKDVILSQPGLWSFYYCADETESETRRLKTWLSRAGSCPLSIAYECGIQREFHPVLDELIKVSHRWRHVEFDFSPRLIDALITTKGRLPLLECLVLEAWKGDEPASSRQLRLRDIFEDAPRLRSICDRDMSNGPVIFPSKFNGPWLQLTKCEARKCNVADILDILRHCPELIKLIVSGDDSDVPPTPIAYTPLRHDHLTSLSFEVASRSLEVGRFLDLVEGPSLRDLEFDYIKQKWPHQEFLSFLSRSSCSLTKLAIVSIELTFDELMGCLRQTPSLVEFCYDKPALGDKVTFPADAVLHELARRRGVGDGESFELVPDLAVLKLTGRNTDLEVIKEVVQSRWSPANRQPDNKSRLQTRLKIAHLPFSWPEAQECEAQRCAITWIEEGLDILLIGYPV